MGTFFQSIGSALGIASSNTVSGALTGVSKLADDIFNTAGDKQKMEQFNSQAQQVLTDAINKHVEALDTLAQEEYDSQLKDIQNARAMEEAIQSAPSGSWMSKNIVPMLAIFVTLIWGSVTVYLILRVLNLVAANPNVNMTTLLGIYTALTACETMVLSYYFGSSSGSKQKDQTISDTLKSTINN